MVAKAAPSKDKEEDSKQQRPERRRTKEREKEREREAGAGKERERASHRDRDGREREARGRDRDRDSRSERHDRDRAHKDRGAERARPDERGSRGRRAVTEAGHKRSRTDDPQERDSRRVRVVEYSDRARDRAERPSAAQDGFDRGLDRWRSDAYRQAHSSSSALHQDSERALKAGGAQSGADRNHAGKWPVSDRMTSVADRDTRRPNGSMSESPRSSRANGSLGGGGRGRFASGQPSPGDSLEGNGASRSLEPAERGSPSDPDRSVQNGSGGRRPLKRSCSRSNSVEVPFPQSPSSFQKGTQPMPHPRL